MKIINNSENAICHGLPLDKKNFYRVEVGEVLNVPEHVANLWLKIKGVEEYAAPEEVKKAEEKVKELEAKIKELEAPKKETSCEKTTTKKPVKKGIKK